MDESLGDMEEFDPADVEDMPDEDIPEEEEDYEEPPAPKKKPAAKAPAKKPAAKKADSTVTKAKFDLRYEYELDGEVVVFTKRRALALKAFIDTTGKADVEVVAADMEKEFGPPRKGSHLASARRVRGLYLKLMEAEAIK
jgi:hypothetical protein